jgi:hypothetical protein
MVYCDKKESINTLHIRTIENPIVAVPNRMNLSEKNNSNIIHIDEDPETIP